MHELMGGFEFIMRGGFMMYPLLLSALLALTVILERFFIFNKRYALSRHMIEQILTHIQNGNFAEAATRCKQLEGPIPSVIRSAIDHFDSPLNVMELAMKNRAEEWIPVLEKRIDVIDTVITAAPLMGLLGTITGMMASFRVLSEKGVNEPNAITGGVAEALIATATGLVIALICLVAYNYLSTRVKNAIYQLESVGSRLVELRMAAERKS